MRVAAHDAMQDDHIGGRQVVLGLGEVHHPPLDLVGEAQGANEFPRRFLVRRRELHVSRTCRAGADKLDLYVADAATDLEHGATGDAAADDVVDDATLCAPQTLAPITIGIVTSSLRVEYLRRVARRAAIAHAVTIERDAQ